MVVLPLGLEPYFKQLNYKVKQVNMGHYLNKIISKLRT